MKSIDCDSPLMFVLNVVGDFYNGFSGSILRNVILEHMATCNWPSCMAASIVYVCIGFYIATL